MFERDECPITIQPDRVPWALDIVTKDEGDNVGSIDFMDIDFMKKGDESDFDWDKQYSVNCMTMDLQTDYSEYEITAAFLVMAVMNSTLAVNEENVMEFSSTLGTAFRTNDTVKINGVEYEFGKLDDVSLRWIWVTPA